MSSDPHLAGRRHRVRTATDRSYLAKTYLYLRLSMVGLVVMLASAVVLARLAAPGWEQSISAYYYTPARAVFVGSLVAIGVGLVAISGNTPGENLALDLAGMLAPLVAFVPSSPTQALNGVAAADAADNVVNNVLALSVLGGVGLIVAWRTSAGSVTARRGAAVAAVGAILFFVWFVAGRDSFLGRAHYAAASLMFLAVVVAVVLNARSSRSLYDDAQGRTTVRLYGGIAVAMVLPSAVMLTLYWVGAWPTAVLWVEGWLITLFAVFWIVQTRELGRHPSRQDKVTGG